MTVLNIAKLPVLKVKVTGRSDMTLRFVALYLQLVTSVYEWNIANGMLNNEQVKILYANQIISVVDIVTLSLLYYALFHLWWAITQISCDEPHDISAVL